MSGDGQRLFLDTYRWARDWRDLPWAHEEPTLFLADICQRRAPGRALDIGCGTGTDSVYLAQQGWQVTALDFVPQALAYTQQRAAAAGVSVTPVEADITRWQPTGRWDLVLDHGLLHNLAPERHAAYRTCVLAALAPDGDFVLLHWHPLHPGQADGRVGPRRVAREAIGRFFAPELQERFFAREEFEDLPEIVGGGMAQACYWFRRNLAWYDPPRLLAQLHATLLRNGVDPAAQQPGTADPALLARIIGPGRLGLSPAVPAAGNWRAAVQPWAAAGGQPLERLGELLALFSDADLGGPCTAEPRCGDCEVVWCKRQRTR